MSADNFIVIREKKDGFFWANLSASYWLFERAEDEFPDEAFFDGPFETYELALEDAHEELDAIEYGVQPDRRKDENVL